MTQWRRIRSLSDASWSQRVRDNLGPARHTGGSGPRRTIRRGSPFRRPAQLELDESGEAREALDWQAVDIASTTSTDESRLTGCSTMGARPMARHVERPARSVEGQRLPLPVPPWVGL